VDFKTTKEYVEQNSKLDVSKFNKVTDITQMIDFLNNERTRKVEEDGKRDILEISKFLVRIATQKSIFLDGKK
jgi:hypothetical protein